MTRLRHFLGVLYATFASWQLFGDKENKGSTGAGMISLLIFFLILPGAYFVRPDLIHRWLSLPPLFRLLLPGLFLIPVAWYFQSGDRGWKWAAEAEANAPRLAARGNFYAIGALIAVGGFVTLMLFFAK